LGRPCIIVQADYAFELATDFGVIGSDDLDQILDEGFQVEYVVDEDCIRCLGSEGYCWNNTGFDNVQSCYYIYSPDGYDSSATHSVLKSMSSFFHSFNFLHIILRPRLARLIFNFLF
jgi:hypothetical protein